MLPSCFAPGLLTPAELVAAAFGAPRPPAATHLARCEACRADTALLVRLIAYFRASFAQQRCSPETSLAEYALRIWLGSERRDGSGHVEACDACSAVSLTLQTLLGSAGAARQSRGLGNIIRWLAAPESPVGADAAVARDRAAPYRNLTYSDERVFATLSLQQEDSHLLLVGLVIEDTGTRGKARARLYAGPRLIADEPVDELGAFVFAAVPTGWYRVEVDTGRTVAVFDPVIVAPW